MASALKDWLPIIAALIAAVAALVALANYWHQTRTKKAEFLLMLHKSFFVEDFYKGIREDIDSDSAERIGNLVRDQSPEFTDFLNFFELVAYMKKQGTLSGGDIEALLGYYLHILRESATLRTYIADSRNGFEYLNKLIRVRARRMV